MANFDLIYTGKERGVKLPTGERIDRASESLSDFITKAETLKYQTFRENEKEFLKTSNIDPAFFISKASQDNQFKLLDEFNKRWSSEYKKYQGNLPMDAKQQMIAEKNFIISQQQEAQANEQRWREHDALVKQNPLRYDRNKHAVNTENFFGTGQYQNVMPPLKSKDFSMYLKDQSNKFNKGKIAYGSAKDEYGRIVDQYANISEKDIPSFIESNLFADDQALQGVTEEFLADQSPEKYALLTDTNKDGKITNADADENIIITWAKRNPKYIDAVRQIDTEAKNPNKSATDVGASIFKGFGKEIKYTPTETRDAGIFGQTKYGAFHDLNVPVQDVNVKEVRVLDPSGETVRQNPGPITADLIGYDEARDEFVFIATKNFYDLQSYTGAKGKDIRFAVKTEDLPEKYKEWEIKRGGQTVRVGSIPKGSVTATPQAETAKERMTRLATEGKPK